MLPHFLNSPTPPQPAQPAHRYTSPNAGALPTQTEYIMPSRARSRTPSVDSVPRSSGEYNRPGPSGSVNASDLTRPPVVVVNPTPPAEDKADGELDDGRQDEDQDADDEGAPPAPGKRPAEYEPFEPLIQSPPLDDQQSQQQQPPPPTQLPSEPEQELHHRGHEQPTAGPSIPVSSSTLSTTDTHVSGLPSEASHGGSTLHPGSSLGESPTATLAPPSGSAGELPMPGRPDLPSNPSAGASKFRTSALKVLQMHRTSSAIQSPGAEQGVDPRRDSSAAHWGHIRAECVCEVVDYSPTRVAFSKFDNAGLAGYLSGRGRDRPSWAKVRWINVGGISWDVVSAIALRYELHPLATEDVLRCGQNGSRSKSEYFRSHLFLSIISHSLAPDDDPPSYADSTGISSSGGVSVPTGAGILLSESPVQETHARAQAIIRGDSGRDMRRRHSSSVWDKAKAKAADVGAGLGVGLGPGLHRPRSRDDIESTIDKVNITGGEDAFEEGAGLDASFGGSGRAGAGPGPAAPPPAPRELESQQAAVRAKEAEQKKRVQARQWASWMNMSAVGRRKAVNQAALEELKKGSHVSVELKHIYVFLTRGGTLITFHQDPDPSVFLPIRHRLQQRDTLLRAHCDASLLMQSVLDLVVDKALEIVDRYHDTLLDLERQILIKPSMKTVRQLHIMSGDLTLHKRTLTPLSSMIYSLRRYDLDRAVASTPEAQDGKEMKVTGFCSHQCKVYLADVYDHMEYILSSMEMFSSIAENLINFTFNIVSYETNQTMRRLTIATVLFFPLTFLTGYFGMNFGAMNSLVGSDLFFWEVAIPVMTVIVLMFTWSDLTKLINAFMRNRHFDLQKEQLKLSSFTGRRN